MKTLCLDRLVDSFSKLDHSNWEMIIRGLETTIARVHSNNWQELPAILAEEYARSIIDGLIQDMSHIRKGITTDRETEIKYTIKTSKYGGYRLLETTEKNERIPVAEFDYLFTEEEENLVVDVEVRSGANKGKRAKN